MKLKTLPGIIFLLLLFSSPSFAQPNKAVNDTLSIINSLLVNDNYIELPKDSILRKYLKIELITEEQYLAKQKTKVNWLVSDTAKYRKKKGVLRLPTANGSKTLTDKLVDDDSRTEYEYLGYFVHLNAYLVREMLWEDMNYNFVSKRNGSTTGFFSTIPLFSPDKKKFVTVYADPYESESEVSVFSVVSGKINNLLYVRFVNWMPAVEKDIFWSSDGKLYLPVQYSDKFWKTDGSYNEDYLYIRISLL
ncbi:MAG: hypothetical protein ABIR30_04890 [Chitinophagaceae bacterium]